MINKKASVLVVDDKSENIQILDGILSSSYNVKVAKNGKTALKVAEKFMPDIILLDILMPDMDGYEVCKRLKSNILTKRIPIIFVSSKKDSVDEKKGFEMGAVDYISKPVSAAIVLSRVSTHLALYNQNKELQKLVDEKTKEIKETRFEIIRRLGMAAEYKDNETGTHIYRVSNYCKIIALNYGLSYEDADLIYNVSSMHDIGKIGISDSILLKPGKLTNEEFEIVKTHTIIGARIIGEHSSELLKIARIVAKEHHEKWDGTGYPDGLKNEEINIFARITAVADVFDALTSIRPYKEPWAVEKALDFIRDESGKHFDPKVINAFFMGIDQILRTKEIYSEDQEKKVI